MGIKWAKIHIKCLRTPQCIASAMEVSATVTHFLYSRICIVNQATMWLSLLPLRMREFAVPSGAETMSVPLCSFPPVISPLSLSSLLPIPTLTLPFSISFLFPWALSFFLFLTLFCFFLSVPLVCYSFKSRTCVFSNKFLFDFQYIKQTNQELL